MIYLKRRAHKSNYKLFVIRINFSTNYFFPLHLESRTGNWMGRWIRHQSLGGTRLWALGMGRDGAERGGSGYFLWIVIDRYNRTCFYAAIVSLFSSVPTGVVVCQGAIHWQYIVTRVILYIHATVPSTRPCRYDDVKIK